MSDTSYDPATMGVASAARGSAAWSVAYLLHLAVPALLLADVLTARVRGEVVLRLASPMGAVTCVSALWLGAGICLFFAIRNRAAMIQRTYAPLVGFYTACLALALMEAGARIVGVTPSIPDVQRPGTRAVIRFSPEDGPGMGGYKIFTINRLGLRGPMPPLDRKVYRIVAIGGSTTICSELDDSEEWPHVLMQNLNALDGPAKAWVGNAGKDSRNAVHHLVLMQWLPGLLDFDMAVFLVGVNDLTATLAFRGQPTQAALEKEAGFEPLRPGTRFRSQRIYPYYRRLRLLLAIQEAAQNLEARFGPPRNLSFLDLKELRQRRLAAPVLPLPDLSTGLKEYRARLIALAAQCRLLGKRCLFLTQPTMWRDNMSSAENRLFWMGYLGRWASPDGYLSPGSMAKAMDLYNQVLLGVCNQYQLECLDLASKIPKNTSAFHDEMHFNPSGAKLVAATLTQYLAQRPPFASAK